MRTRKYLAVRAVGALALVGGTFGGLLAFGGGTAGATNNTPAGNPTSPAVSYESDCTTTLSPGDVAPFISSTVINTTTDSATPGTSFGVDGAVSETLLGNVIAGFEATFPVNLTSLGLTVNETFGSTDGHASGTYAYTHTYTAVAPNGGKVKTVTYAEGVTTIPGNFSAAAVGDAVAGDGITSAAAITAVNGTTSITISVPTTAAGSKKTIGWGGTMVFTDDAFSSGTVFTVGSGHGVSDGIGVTSVKSVTVNTNFLDIGFGTTTSVCTETGWTATDVPGPSNPTASTPQLPPGYTTALISGGDSPVFEPGAYLTVPALPLAVTTTSLPSGTQHHAYSETLAATGGYPSYTWSVTAGSLPAGLSLNDSTGVISGTPTGSGLSSFTVQVEDSHSQTATATLSITIAATTGIHLDQTFQQTVAAGNLTLSCTHAVPAEATVVDCTLITLPKVTLNGQTQNTSATMNPIYVSDARGNPDSGWSLTAALVGRANSNPSCLTVIGFCNQTVGTKATVANKGNIPGSNFTLTGFTCAPEAGNVSPAPTPGAGGALDSTVSLCTAAAGTSGGSFEISGGTYALTLPQTLYAGKYLATVQYTVAGT